jgi:F0F1-type ATP synthase assembly protein I
LGTVALDLLNTAWRIAVPVLVFAGAGILADRQWNTAPWTTLLGLVVGFVFAGLLIQKQLAQVNDREAQK